jgi:hypothetical protein
MDVQAHTWRGSHRARARTATQLRTAAEIDAAIASAVAGAARRLSSESSGDEIGEKKHLEPALRAELAKAYGERVHPGQQQLRFEHWEAAKGRLGGVDLLVHDGVGGWSALVELKWCCTGDVRTLGWTLWDILKMASGRVSPGATACYAIVGAPTTLFEKPGTLGELFTNGEWCTRELIHRFTIHWQDLLSGGTARVSQLPAGFTTTLVCDQALPSPIHAWRLRAIRVDPLDGSWTEFADGWPVVTSEDHLERLLVDGR